MLDLLKKEFGPISPKIAEHLNSLGLRHYHGCGDAASALQCHQEALAILDWNKCNALLFDRVDEGKQFAVDMAITLSDIGNVLREMNDFLGAAVAYKECLDLFLEGLIDGGGTLKRKLMELEYEEDYEEQEARALEGVDREAIGSILGRHPGFRSAVRGISHLLREMQYVKFVAQNAASSRRRRKMTQDAVVVANIANAIASLNLSTSDLTTPTFERSVSHEETRDEPPAEAWEQPFVVQIPRSKSWASTHSTKDEVRRNPPLPRPSPIGRRAITSEEDYDRHVSLYLMLIPVEKSLTSALYRFPGVSSIIVGRQRLSPSPSANSIDNKPNDLIIEGKFAEVLLGTSGQVPPVEEAQTTRSSAKNICEHFSNDFLSYSISCGGGMAI